jgi:ubiquinone/menaquinone biosynthesis C-methylase UbiE
LNWLDFWNGNHSIYVCDKHRQRHHMRVGEDIVQRLPPSTGVVIDYGCGEALSAEHVARHCEKLILSDGAASVRERLNEWHQNAKNVSVLAPDEVLDLDEGSVDCIIINSVLQYLAFDDTQALLEGLAPLLAPNGRIIVGDIIPPDHTVLADAGALLHFAWQEQFMTEAMIGLMRTFLSDYRKIRAAYGLTRYSSQDIETIGARLGLRTQRTALNIGHDQGRMTFELQRVAA